MSGPEAVAAPAVDPAGLAELAECAPIRDLAQRQDGAPAMASVLWPAAHGDAGAAAAGGLDALQSLPAARRAASFAAAVAVLLSRHARRQTIAAVLQRPPPRGAVVLRLRLAADRAFADLVDEVQAAGAGATRPDTLFTGPTAPVLICVDEPPQEPAQASAPEPAPEAPDAAPAAAAALPAGVAFRLRRSPGGFLLQLDHDTRAYRHDSIVPLARQLVQALAVVGADPGIALGRIDLLEPAERERVLRGFNAHRAALPVHDTLAEQIEAQCRLRPHAVCAVHRGAALTFEALNRAANQAAGWLRAVGVGPGRFVAVVDHRGLNFLVAMLAIWKAGAAYVPVDPGYPEDRVRHMLLDSEVAVAFCGAGAWTRHAAAIADCERLRHVLCLDAPGAGLPPPAPHQALHGPATLQGFAAGDAAAVARATDAAYMIYTSGSTGRPKGAIVRHDGALNHIHAQALALGRDSVARFLQTAPSSSDISVWQLAAPLVLGGTTVIVDDATDVEDMLRQVRQHGLHIIELVPAVLKHLVDYAAALPADERRLPTLRWAMVTGESAPVSLVNRWLHTFPGVPMVNAYGPSEAADDVAQAILREPLPPDQLTVPIGRPLANMSVYVLDADLQPVPVGAPGEICVAGIGVGAGYWKRPERTRESFVANAVDPQAGPVLYRTGDLGRLRDDGTLECLGRSDHQVQLRGFRIELQEVEAVLREHPGVADVVARVFHDGHGDGTLVAYVVPAAGADLAVEPLRAHAASRLAPAMLPARYVRLASLPLNPAGKVDRQALQPPADDHDAGRAAADAGAAAPAPATPGEAPAAMAVLRRLWQQELGRAAIGPDEDFFALGGDSLAALAVVVGARERGWHLRTVDFVAHPTLAALAAVARPLPPVAPAATADAGRGNATIERPMSAPQQGIFVHWLLARDKSAYVDQYAYRIDGALDPRAFEQAWQLVVQRHAALRSSFHRRAGGPPVQRLHAQAALDIRWLDHAGLDAAQQALARQQLGADELARGIDLARPPLMRLVVARLAPGAHWLLWTHHHIVLDGWSMSIVLREVLTLHDVLRDGATPALAPAPDADGAAADRDGTACESFWRAHLAGYTGAPDYGGSADLNDAGGAGGENGAHAPPRGYGQTDRWLGAADTRAVHEAARRAGVTPTTLVQAAWAATLARLAGQGDVVFGTVSSGRESAATDSARRVGLFVTTLPLRVDARRRADGPGLQAWLAALQAQAFALREQAAVPLSRIARWSEVPPGRPLLASLFVMSNYPGVEAAPGASLRLEPEAWRTVPAYPLSLIAVPGPTLQLRVVHDRRELAPERAAQAADLVAALLLDIAAGRDPRLAAERA